MDNKSKNQQKLLKIIVQKLKDGEIILSIQQIIFLSLRNKKPPICETLVITTSCLYFYQEITLKKYFKASAIQQIIMTAYSNELIICVKEGKETHHILNLGKQKDKQKEQFKQSFIRIQSDVNVRIIKSILEVRQKFIGMQMNKANSYQKLHISLVKDKTLESYPDKLSSTDQNKGRIYSFFMSRVSYEAKDKSQTFSRETMRQSLECQMFTVSLKNFALKIGQKMYEQIYTSVHLLYINSDQNFRFVEENYNCQIVNSLTKIFRLKKNQSKQVQNCSKQRDKKTQSAQSQLMMRKIVKRQPEQNKQIVHRLSNYINYDFKEEIKYSIETQTHFQVIVPLASDENSIEQILYKQGCSSFAEKDIRSVFIKMMEMIEVNPNQIFYSLSLDKVRISREGGIIISEIFSCIQKQIQIDYIAPEQFKLWEKDNSFEFSSKEIQLINLWKVGILIFQMSYGNSPFPVQFILEKFMKNDQEIILNFPEQIFRTMEFKTFIQSILQINSTLRGGSSSSMNWKDKIMKQQWMRIK